MALSAEYADKLRRVVRKNCRYCPNLHLCVNFKKCPKGYLIKQQLAEGKA